MPNWTRTKGRKLFPGASHATDLEVSMIKTGILRSPGRVITEMLMSLFSPGESISPSFTVKSSLNSYSLQEFNHFAGRKKIMQRLPKYSIF